METLGSGWSLTKGSGCLRVWEGLKFYSLALLPSPLLVSPWLGLLCEQLPHADAFPSTVDIPLKVWTKMSPSFLQLLLSRIFVPLVR